MPPQLSLHQDDSESVFIKLATCMYRGQIKNGISLDLRRLNGGQSSRQKQSPVETGTMRIQSFATTILFVTAPFRVLDSSHGWKGVATAWFAANFQTHHADEILICPIARVRAKHVQILDLEGPAR